MGLAEWSRGGDWHSSYSLCSLSAEFPAFSCVILPICYELQVRWDVVADSMDGQWNVKEGKPCTWIGQSGSCSNSVCLWEVSTAFECAVRLWGQIHTCTWKEPHYIGPKRLRMSSWGVLLQAESRSLPRNTNNTQTGGSVCNPGASWLVEVPSHSRKGQWSRWMRQVMGRMVLQVASGGSWERFENKQRLRQCMIVCVLNCEEN